MLNFLKIIIYIPLVNLLAVIISVMPGGDIGLAIIVLTFIIKIALYPLTQKALVSQIKMNLLAPELKKIKESGASKEEQARLQFELYRKHKANPFSGCLVQIPIIIVIISLFHIFSSGIKFDNGILYSFIKAPENLNTMFLGLVDITQKSFILAVLAGVSQYFQAYYMPKPPTPDVDDNSFQASFGKSMNMQMKYFFPVFIFLILYTNILGDTGSGALALYWITNNIFTIGQQIYASKKKVKMMVHGEKVESPQS